MKLLAPRFACRTIISHLRTPFLTRFARCSVKQVNGCINYVEVEAEGGNWFFKDEEGEGDGDGDGVEEVKVDEEVRKNREVMR